MCSYDYDYDTGYRDYVECGECREATQKLYNVEQALAQVVKLLYSREKLDVALLDDAIGQMCDSVGFESPATLPRVRRHGSEIFEFAVSVNQ
jgi:hypothetical protein